MLKPGLCFMLRDTPPSGGVDRQRFGSAVKMWSCADAVWQA
jgi:hypothetical protein